MRGTAPVCLRRPPGSCTSPSRLPSRAVRGVSTSDSRKPTPNTTAKAASGVVSLTGSKLPVSCVAQARYDEADLVKLLVDGGDVDRHVRVRVTHGLDSC